MAHSRLSPHHAERVDLPGRYGHLAALRGRAHGDRAGTVLLLPGYTGSKEDFAPLLDPITDGGFDVLAVDLPGQHESPGPEVETEYLPSMLAADVVDLVEKLAADGERPLLLGHSFGGLVARGAVLAGAPVAGLTLLDSGPSELPDGERRSALLGGAPVLREHGIEAAWQYRIGGLALLPRWQHASEEQRSFERRVFLATSPTSLLGMGQALLDEPDLTDALAAALDRGGIPAAVVCGENDDAWSTRTQQAMAERLGARFAVVPAAAHSPNVENPDELLAVLLPLWASQAHQ